MSNSLIPNINFLREAIGQQLGRDLTQAEALFITGAVYEFRIVEIQETVNTALQISSYFKKEELELIVLGWFADNANYYLIGRH